MSETKSRLPDEVVAALLRDAGHAPKDSHPDGHFRRETPPLPQPLQPQRRPVIRINRGQ